MSVHRFTAIALTPIHIGDGTLWTPEDYILDGADGVARFDWRQVVADLGEGRRRQYLTALDSGHLQEAVKLLQSAVDTQRHVVDRVAVAQAARTKLSKWISDPLQRARVLPFTRAGRRVCIPGSSLKGALRTALLSSIATGSKDPIVAAPPLPATAGVKASAARSKDLERVALDLGPSATDTDPFRFLAVSDALVPDGKTIIDVVRNWRPKPKAAGAKLIEMQVERLWSRADRRAVTFDVELRVDTDHALSVRARDAGRSNTARRVPRQAFTLEQVMKAANQFYWRRFDQEREHFFETEQATKSMLTRVFELKQDWNEKRVREAGEQCALLRVGRFGQFESKSVDGLRQGYEAKSKKWRAPDQPGRTRNVVMVKTPNGDAPCPMGWLLLVRRS